MIKNLPEKFQEKIKQKLLMISVSGIRAILPNGLTPDMIFDIMNGFCEITKEKIIIGNDGRVTSPILEDLIVSILSFYGKKIIRLGIAPTPTIKAGCNFFKADAGIIITASHNPIEWNGIKFLKKDGSFFDKEDYEKLFDSLKNPHEFSNQIQYQIKFEKGIEKHIESISSFIPNIEKIRKKKYKVLMDPVNSSGIFAVSELLKYLNCEIIQIHSKPNIPFERKPEPTPENLKKFSKILKEKKIQIGFALDPDGDRLVLGSPKYGAISEEYTLPLAYLGKKLTLKKSSNMVINYSTSSILEKIAKPDGHKVYRAPVGEVNVLNKMLQLKGKFGGEGNGGVIDPAIPSKGRDSLTGIFYILSAMAEKNANTIDDLLKELPSIYMGKLKIPYNFEKKEENFNKIQESIKQNYKKIQSESYEDGYFISFEDQSWIHIRFSNTEPIMRIIFEENSKKEYKKTYDFIQLVLKNL